MRVTPSCLKGLAETRARAAGRYQMRLSEAERYQQMRAQVTQ